MIKCDYIYIYILFIIQKGDQVDDQGQFSKYDLFQGQFNKLMKLNIFFYYIIFILFVIQKSHNQDEQGQICQLTKSLP